MRFLCFEAVLWFIRVSSCWQIRKICGYSRFHLFHHTGSCFDGLAVGLRVEGKDFVDLSDFLGLVLGMLTKVLLPLRWFLL